MAVPAATVAFAALVYFMGMDGPFGAVLAVAVLFLGNLLSLPLNIGYVRRASGPMWLKCVVVAQALPVLAAAALVGRDFAERRSERESHAQRQTLQTAIVADDPAAFKDDWKRCEERCRGDGDPLPGLLYDAAAASAWKTITVLIAPPYSVRDRLAPTPCVEHACDGSPILVRDALAMAVAHNTEASLGLLLPLADARSRGGALWLAARLDRYRMVQALLAAGVPLAIRGETGDVNETLLVAAAQGAALRVGRWLVEDKAMPVDGIVGGLRDIWGRSPLEAVLSGGGHAAGQLDRTRAFVKLLLDHGANIDARRDDRVPSALDEMVDNGDRERATLLLELGARRSRLSKERRVELDELLALPPREPSPDGCAGSVHSGD